MALWNFLLRGSMVRIGLTDPPCSMISSAIEASRCDTDSPTLTLLTSDLKQAKIWRSEPIQQKVTFWSHSSKFCYQTRVIGCLSKITLKPDFWPSRSKIYLTGNQYSKIGAFWRPTAVKKLGSTVILLQTSNHTGPCNFSMNVTISFNECEFQGMGI